MAKAVRIMTSKKELILLISVVNLLSRVSCTENLLVYPCTDFEAIRWVRDSTFCEQYYICHFGQPLAMPACPTGQVWSNGALNCVPRESVWDDCQASVSPTQSDTTRALENTLKTTQTPAVTRLGDLNNTPNNIVVSIEQISSISSPTYTTAQKRLPENNKQVALPEYHMSLQTKERRVKVPESWYEQLSNIKHTIGAEITTPTPASAKRNTEQARATTTAIPRGSRLLEVVFEEKTRLLKHRLNATYQLFKVDPDHQCFHQPGALLPHPDNCHWYINCSLANLDDLDTKPGQTESDDPGAYSDAGFVSLQPFRVRHAGVFVWECRYPQLFDDATGRCREFMNVDCKSKFEPVDQCEYTARHCRGGRCVPCERRFGRCRRRQNGVYPLYHTRWTPVFVTCYQQRNIAQDECTPPTPVFSPELLDCVSLFDVPKQHGGFLPDCSTRPDGYYPDEQGRCAIFFRCALGHFRGYDECPPGSVFDPTIPACQPYSYASKPCGEGRAPLCGGKMDGLYADPYGRCTNYFQCQAGVFQQYSTCDLGIFDPLTQRCVVSAELTVRPCGLQPSPCEALPTGVYPDQATGCRHFIECHHGNMITNGTCEQGTVFSAITGRCDLAELTPPPCGVSSVCSDKPDGRYPALDRGCSFFYECAQGEFLSLRRCTEDDGGIFFNPETGRCDYPQNICPPCGYRWWGCPRTYPF
ncbi:hypothetical protein BsWGS_01025 [Bradybaena similaris]